MKTHLKTENMYVCIYMQKIMPTKKFNRIHKNSERIKNDVLAGKGS